MNQQVLVTGLLVIFLCIFAAISFAAAKFNKKTPEDYFLAGRGLGPIVLLMTIGATSFSTWTLLGGIGEYYRNGVWFYAFTAWAVVQGIFIWIFGVRIWQLSKQYGFITPGDMVEHYYNSSTLRLLFAIFGVVGLVPYMLIQITGGAAAIDLVSGGMIPYSVGVILLGVFVAALVIKAGGRGAAWTDTFMGAFFGLVLLGAAIAITWSAGGTDSVQAVASVAPDLVVVRNDFGIIIDTAVGFLLAVWIMPQAWQKFCSAKSADAVTKAAGLTPIWNSWLMALTAGIIGLMANAPNILENLTAENGDMTLPLYFRETAPMFSTVVVVAIVAAGMSTINSQMLSSSSVITTDVYSRYLRPESDEDARTKVGRIVVGVLCVIVVAIAFLPAVQGYIVPFANNGLAIVSQLAPAALGPLLWRKATKTGAIASIVVGESLVLYVMIFGSPSPNFGATSVGIGGALVTFVMMSLMTQNEVTRVQSEYHDSLRYSLYGTKARAQESQTRVRV